MRNTIVFASFVLLSLPIFSSGCSAVEIADARVERATAGKTETEQRLEKLHAAPCDFGSDGPSGYLCVRTKHKLEHANGRSKEITVTFAVHPAPEATRKGIFIHSTGGPGYSGIDNVIDFTKLDARILDTYDVVTFDLRGVGKSGGLECKKAAATFYLGGLRSGSPTEDDALVAKSRTFVDACVREMGIAKEDVQFYNTDEAAADLEDFRAYLQDGRQVPETKWTLYGLSYGTQLMQTYARHYPEHTRAMVIDGVVDLTLDHLGYMKNLNDGINLLVDETLKDCANKPRCADAFKNAPGRAALDRVRAGYDAVAAHLDRGQETVQWKLASGRTEARFFSRNDLDTTSFNAAGSPDTRRDLQRALGAAYTSGDYLPLLTTSYTAASLEDVDDQGPVGTANADPDISDAIYYAVTCSDYGHESPDEATRSAAYLKVGQDLRNRGVRVLSPYYGDLPCVFWPTARASQAQPVLRARGVRTMVVDATGDGATPFDMGEAVYKGLDDGHFVRVDGGHHVMYAHGNRCVDDAVDAFLLDVDQKNATPKVTQCKDEWIPE
jgi:pimeloyl-ACP methyl ester carboxylesterase